MTVSGTGISLTKSLIRSTVESARYYDVEIPNRFDEWESSAPLDRARGVCDRSRLYSESPGPCRP